MSAALITWLGFASRLAISFLYTWRLAYLAVRRSGRGPVMLAIGGIVLVGFSFVQARMTAVCITDGIVDFRSRRFGHVFASRDLVPVEFWLLIAAMHGAALLLASCGAASFAVCWNNRADEH